MSRPSAPLLRVDYVCMWTMSVYRDSLGDSIAKSSS